MTDIVSLVVGIVTLGLLWCFYIPYLCFNLHRFRKHVLERRQSLIKRHPAITIVAAIIGVLWLAIYSMTIVGIFLDIEALAGWGSVLGIIFAFGFSYTILLRVWLAYYRIEYYYASTQQAWQKYIHQKALTQNWFMQNWKTYGNHKWMKNRTIAASAGSIVLFFLCSVWSPLFVIQFLLYILPWIGIGYLYFKMPHFNDDIAIRKEMKYVLILYSTLIFSQLVILYSSYFVGNNDTAALIVSGIFIHIFMFVIFSICHTMTYWVLRNLNIIKSKNSNNNNGIGIRFIANTQNDEESMNYEASATQLSYTQWFRRIKNKKSMDKSVDPEPLVANNTVAIPLRKGTDTITAAPSNRKASNNLTITVNNNNNGNDGMEVSMESKNDEDAETDRMADLIDGFCDQAWLSDFASAVNDEMTDGEEDDDNVTNAIEKRELEAFTHLQLTNADTLGVPYSPLTPGPDSPSASGGADQPKMDFQLNTANKNNEMSMVGSQTVTLKSALSAANEKSKLGQSVSVDPMATLKDLASSDLPVKEVKITLQMMFAKMKFFNKFMAHLQNEFSPEILLFTIEIVQAQVLMLMHIHKYKNFYRKQYRELNVKSNIQLPKGMPKSAIVWGNYDSLVNKYIERHNNSGKIISLYEKAQIEFRLISFQLYKRYIKPYSAEFEINISSSDRQNLVKLLDNYDVWMSPDFDLSVMNVISLINLFEECKQSQFRLLLASFSRYKQKSEFNSIQEYYSGKLALMRKQHKKEEKMRRKMEKQNGNGNKKAISVDDASEMKSEYTNNKMNSLLTTPVLKMKDIDSVEDSGLVLVDGYTPNDDHDNETNVVSTNNPNMDQNIDQRSGFVTVETDTEAPN